MNKRKMKNVLIVALVGILSAGCVDITSGIGVPNSQTNDKLNAIIGTTEKDLYVCEASIIEKSEIEYSPCIDLSKQLQNQTFLDEWGMTLALLGDDDDTYLYEKKGCYLSACGVYMFNIEEYGLANIVRCFIFTEGGEYAGEIYFSAYNGELSSNVVLRHMSTDRQSDILEMLSQYPDNEAILLTNGYRHMFLDENNQISKSDQLSNDVAFEVVGDCYHALNEQLLGVSYNEIVDRNNWVWIGF